MCTATATRGSANPNPSSTGSTATGHAASPTSIDSSTRSARMRSASPRAGTTTEVEAARTPDPSQRLELLGDIDYRGLGVAEQHRGLLVIEQRVVDAGETAAHRALEHDHPLALVQVEDRHAVDR